MNSNWVTKPIRAIREGRPQQRYGEIDALRAVALLLMILFHLVYDFQNFGGAEINYQAPLWWGIGKASALLFMFVSGLSSGFSRSPAKRGVEVLLWGMVVTAATYFVLPEEYVRFGILHFLGVAMLLSPLFRSLPNRTLSGLAVIFALLGVWFKEQTVSTALLLPLGLAYAGYKTIDYYPLFPYLAVTILGIIVYKTFYARQAKKSALVVLNFKLKSKLLQWVSRRSLGIYLVHQPLIVAALLVLKRLSGCGTGPWF